MGPTEAPSAVTRPEIAFRRAIAAVTLLAAALVLFRIGNEPFDYDEAYSLRFIREGWLGIWTTDNGNQVLFLGLLRAWHAIATSEAAVRVLSALAFVATVPTVALLARRVFDRRVAVIAALLTATHPALVIYGGYVRGYAWMVFLFSAGVLGLVAGVQERRGAPTWAGVALLAAAPFAHPASALGVVAVLAWLWWLLPDDVPLSRLRACVAVGVVWIPLAVIMGSAGSGQIAWAEGYETLRAAGVLYTLAGDTRLSGVLLLVALGGAFLAARTLRDRARTIEGWTAGLPLVWIGGSAILVAAVAVRQSLLVGRFLLFLAVPVVLLVAHALATVPWRKAAVLLLAAVLLYHGSVALRRAGTWRDQPWDRIDALLSSVAQPGDGLVAIPKTIVVPLEEYHLRHGGGPPDPVVPKVTWGAMPVLDTLNVRTPPPLPTEPLPDRVWVVVPSLATRAERAYLQTLLSGHRRAESIAMDKSSVELWVRV